MLRGVGSNHRDRLMRPCWNRLQSTPQKSLVTLAFQPASASTTSRPTLMYPAKDPLTSLLFYSWLAGVWCVALPSYSGDLAAFQVAVP